MPRVSVVVPIYNVEDYLAECLDSIAGQTMRDFEVVLVDDGSTDSSHATAEAYAQRDERFRLITQANAGLGAARNAGTAAATGEFLLFVDSDDVIAPNALARLLGVLDRTGSDFATANVQRLSSNGTRQAYFLSRVFTRTRLRTHVTRQRALIADRTAWNKLWRRSFWDVQGYEFPVGVFNEDIPVVVPAHFAARSVDVIAEPLYFWRAREGGAASITQRRLELRALQDRLRAVEHVIAHLDANYGEQARHWYEQSILAHDLRYHLDVLDEADEPYRELFLDRANAILAAAGPQVLDELPAVERRKWELVRARDLPALFALLEQQREAPPSLRVRVARRIPERHRRRLRGLVESVRR